MIVQYVGVLFLGLMTLNAWAWLSVLQSGAGLTKKLIWTAVLLLPVLGFLAWFLIGPRRRAA